MDGWMHAYIHTSIQYNTIPYHYITLQYSTVHCIHTYICIYITYVYIMGYMVKSKPITGSDAHPQILSFQLKAQPRPRSHSNGSLD